MNKTNNIYVAGHTGLVGSAIIRKLKEQGYNNIITSDYDLRREIPDFLDDVDYIFDAAAIVGGIKANQERPVDFLLYNLQIQNNLIESAFYSQRVKKFLFLGSSCIYPKYADQPITENSLLKSELEPTNEYYAIAKIAGIKLCQAFNKQYPHGTKFISVMPTNLYGIGDHYEGDGTHVIPALIKKIHNAKVKRDKEVSLWGTGNALREFLYVDDCAEACIFLMNNYESTEIINIGSGREISINDTATVISIMMYYYGNIIFNNDQPDGTPRKMVDSSKINILGWCSKTSLWDGLVKTYEDFTSRYGDNNTVE